MKSEQFQKISISPDWYRHLISYPHGFTIYENLIDWVSRTNVLIKNVNDWNKYLEEFVNTFDKNLRSTVSDTLNVWYDDGTLAKIINEDVFNMKADKDWVEQELETTKDSINSRIDLLNRGTYNVLSYGAKLDGVTDDTAAFQACADDIEANGGGVFFIPHSEKGAVIAGTINMPGNVVVMGNKTWIFAKSIDNADTPFWWVDKSDISIYDLYIDGMKDMKNANLSVSGGSNCLTFEGKCENIRVLNSKFVNTLEHGISFMGRVHTDPDRIHSCSNVVVMGCTFENNGNPYYPVGPRGAGIMLITNGTNMKFTNNTFRNFVRVGMYCDSAYSPDLDDLYPGLSVERGDYSGYDILIVGNKLEVDYNHWGHVTDNQTGAGIAVHGQQRLFVSNNVILIDRGKYRGISIDDSQESSPTNTIFITSNLIRATAWTIEVKDVSGVTISDNQLYNTTGSYDTVRIEYITRRVANIIIDNNTIYNQDYACVAVFNEFGTSSQLEYITISNNKLYGYSNTNERSCGVWTSRAMRHIAVKDNVISNSYYGVLMASDAAYAYIYGNKINDCEYGIHSNGPAVAAFNLLYSCTVGVRLPNEDAANINNVVNKVLQ